MKLIAIAALTLMGCAGSQAPALVTVACERSEPITLEVAEGESLRLNTGSELKCGAECEKSCQIIVSR